VLERDVRCFEVAGDELKDNYEFVSHIVSRDKALLRFASDRVKTKINSV